MQFLIDGSESAVYNLIRNCISSKVTITKLMTEVIIPSIAQTQALFDDGKIGKSEQQLMTGIISNSIQMITHHSTHSESGKNIIILSFIN